MRAKKVTGFVGWVTYEMRDEESEWNQDDTGAGEVC
jgi:CRISPR/Cas system endoribonuclease Cas6 (RAMP superfamily)